MTHGEKDVDAGGTVGPAKWHLHTKAKVFAFIGLVGVVVLGLWQHGDAVPNWLVVSLAGAFGTGLHLGIFLMREWIDDARREVIEHRRELDRVTAEKTELHKKCLHQPGSSREEGETR